MRTPNRSFVVVAMLSAAATAARAQAWERMTNPSVQIAATHPAQLALRAGTKVAVLEFTGNPRCGPELTSRMTQELLEARRFDMIDRAAISAALFDQNFQNSGLVSQQARLKIGQMLGPSALFTGRITRCTTDRSAKLKDSETKDKAGKVKVKYVRRATGHLTAQVSLVDVTTGQVQAGDLIEVVDTLVNEAFDADPEVPGTDKLLSRMYASATAQLAHIILPWREMIGFLVYDDDKCGLKSTAAQLKRGQNTEAAAALQGEIARQCSAPQDRTLLAKALNNLGVALVSQGRHEEALKAFQAATTERKSGIEDDAIAATNKIMQLREAERLANDHAPATEPAPPPASGQATLSNRDVIDMSVAKLSDAVIVAKIKTSPCRFDVSTDGLIALKKAGVSDGVILEMTNSRCQ